ncbi:hypothetical protein [Salinigranum halophilum]|uniref:hypothetical protein n=1 Tax=Salinigranum halophilum TaxID=2565931 RepID=UPI001375E917|nr:hypothetical protein [Salinigranum halophilum]
MLDKAKQALGLGSAPRAPPGFPDGEGDMEVHEVEPGVYEMRAPGEGPLDMPTPGNDTAQMERGDDVTVRRPYTDREEYEFRSLRSPRYRGDDPAWHHNPPGNSVWERVMNLASTAPIQGNPSLDPAVGDMVQVSAMAGYKAGEDVGHDSMEGVSGMVTGSVDARRELEAPSATQGSPTQMAPDESIFSDDMGFGDMGLSYQLTPGEREDDMAELSYREPGSGWDDECEEGQQDWCAFL